MQYQVFNEKTGELVAWIDTKKKDAVCMKGFDVKRGKNLTVHEENDLEKVDNYILFSIVSQNEWRRALESEISKGSKIITEEDISYDTYYNIRLPKRATVGSAGYDFINPFNHTIEIPPRGNVVIPTGIRCKMPVNVVLSIYPRSGLGFKHGIHLANTVGIIDSDYFGNIDNEGHIMCKLVNPTDNKVVIERGVAFAQGVFTNYLTVVNDSVDAKRVGGLGSTDNSCKPE